MINYLIVWKEGADLKEDGEMFKCNTKDEAIELWLESESVKTGRYFILFFEDGTVYDDILHRKYNSSSAWRKGFFTKDVAKYVKERIK